MLSAAIVRALCARDGPVALAGIGGAGKSTLAAGACADRRVRRAFRDGITWLEAGPGQDPLALLADLARRLGLPETAAGFATIGQGRDRLTAELRGKRVLIAVDNVWDHGALDALTRLAPTCAVLFTTRVPELATTVSATQILVDELTPEQALELLGRWTGQARAVLPETARLLCTRVGNLALGVAMAGAMVARGRSFTDVLDLIELDLTRVRADLDPAYPYQTLFAAIEAGITDLPEDSQRRYAQLAVFAGRGPFPRDAARALWQLQLPDAEVGDLLAELTGRSLLTAACRDWYVAHDLQYDVLARRLGPAGLAGAHAWLLDGYRLRYPGGWAGSAADPYLARTLAGHLHDAGLGGELRTVLTDAAWIQTRLTHGQLPDLIPDYSYAQDSLTGQILRALRLSAPVLAADPAQVRGQLAGRLIGHFDPEIAAWARDLTRQHGPGAWLVPLTPALTPTTDPLQQILTGHDGRVSSAAVTADGTMAVSGGDDGSVRVWDLATGRERAKLTGHAHWVLSVAVTADGTTAVSGGDDGSVRIWDLATGRERAKLTGHTKLVSSVAVTADGTMAVSGGRDRSVRIWDLATGRERAKLTGHDGPVLSVAVTADGTMAVSGGDDGLVRIWDLATGRERAKLTGHTKLVSSVAVTADGTMAVSGGRDRSVRIWDLATGRERAKLTGHTNLVLSVAVTADGTMAVSGGDDGSVRVWDLATGRERAKLTSHDGRVSSVAVTGDGTTAVSGGYDGLVRVWDLAAGRERAKLTGHDDLVSSVAVTADGTTAVSGGYDGSVRIWDLAADRERAKLTGHTNPVLSVAVTADGTTAVSGGEDGLVRVWDLAAGRERAELIGGGMVESVALTADGTMAVSVGEDGSVRVWDLGAGRERAELADYDDQVSSVAVTADGTTAVSGGADGLVRVWDSAAGRERAKLTGHDDLVRSVAVTADGTTAVSGGRDGSVRAWDLATGRERAKLTGHDDLVSSVAVTADGTTAVSGGRDGSVRIWDLATGTQVARWDGDYPIVGCTVLPGRPLKIGVGEQQGQPYLLGLRGEGTTRQSDPSL